MNLHQILLILRARYLLVLTILATTLVAAAVACMLVAPRYSAVATLVVDFKGIDPITGTVLPAQMMSNYMATEVDIIQSRAVALKVVRALKLSEKESMKQLFMETADGKGSIEDWLASGLLSKLDVKPSRESRIVDVAYTAASPEFAASVANAFASAYRQMNLEMKVSPARDSAQWFDGQLKQLREQVETAQSKLSRYQSEKGITSTDQRLDVETARLSEISSQLIQAQAQSYENASRQKQVEEFLSKNRSIDSLPEVLASPVIQDLKSRLSAAETRLSQASGTLGANHPEYLKAQAEVVNLRKRLGEEVRTTASVIGNNLKISMARERELQAAVASQKARLLDMNRNRDDLGVLMKELENAQRAYESASQRHTETSLESRIDQSNVVILNPAIAPLEPSFPKLPLTMALAMFIGTVLGIGVAFAAEMIDRRVRGVEDLMAAAGAPVWGILGNTSAVSKDIERKRRIFMKRPRTLMPIQEPTLE